LLLENASRKQIAFLDSLFTQIDSRQFLPWTSFIWGAISKGVYIFMNVPAFTGSFYIDKDKQVHESPGSGTWPSSHTEKTRLVTERCQEVDRAVQPYLSEINNPDHPLDITYTVSGYGDEIRFVNAHRAPSDRPYSVGHERQKEGETPTEFVLRVIKEVMPQLKDQVNVLNGRYSKPLV
jgi:hypothetical protein